MDGGTSHELASAPSPAPSVRAGRSRSHALAASEAAGVAFREGTFREPGDEPRLCLRVRTGTRGPCCAELGHKPNLQVLVFAGRLRVLAQVVAKCEGLALLSAARLHDVDVVGVRPRRGPMEERAEGIV